MTPGPITPEGYWRERAEAAEQRVAELEAALERIADPSYKSRGGATGTVQSHQGPLTYRRYVSAVEIARDALKGNRVD